MERKTDKRIELHLTIQSKEEANWIKVLVLGCDCAGKSAFLKQARQFYGKKFTTEELATWKEHVHCDILSQVLGILGGAKKLQLKLDPELCAPFQKDGFDEKSQLTLTVANSIRELWEDARTQLVWRERSRCNVRDSFEYFIANLDRIAGEEYVPSYADILQVGINKSSVEEVNFRMKETNFRLYNIGQMWREPRRYLRFFAGITLVVYFVALNEYDEYTSDDEDKLKHDESFEIFESVVTDPLISSSGILLILNKVDLFKRKLRDVPYRVDFGPKQRNLDFQDPEIKDLSVDLMGSDVLVEAAIKHVEKRFAAVAGTGRMYSCPTSVIDTTTIKALFASCVEHVLRLNMSKSGLVSF